jgi:hypothetical protein
VVEREVGGRVTPGVRGRSDPHSVGRAVALYDGRDDRLASQLPAAKPPAKRAELAQIRLNQRGNGRD